jgi:glycosyltransferase involved in cell wall biosynthesis
MTARRALVIAPFLPEFDRESGLRRVSDHVDMLLRRGWEVTYGCLYPPRERERYLRALEQRGVETHAPLESIDSIRTGTGFELAILAFWQVAERFLPELRQSSPTTRVIVDSVDLHFLRDARDVLRPDAESVPGQLEKSQAGDLARELNTYAAADAVLTVSEKEAAMVNDFAARGTLAFPLPDTEELPRSPVPLRERRGILFLANFGHAPNRDAASYLCQEIVPRLDPALLAEHELSIVGTAAEEHVGGLARGVSHAKTVGWVPSVLPYLNTARVSVVPLRYGAGTKRKVIQALMVGTPTVTTSVGAEGLGLRDGRHALIADDPGAFAAAIERLLKRPLAWRRLARRGRGHVIRLHGRATVESRFDRLLETVFARDVVPPAVRRAVGDGVVRSPDYARLVAQVHEAAESEIPANARVLVASRGDNGLLAFEGRHGWHFPRDSDGRYAGYYPADSEAAIDHLEELRAKGATHLVLPRTAFWWLDYYEGLREHLEAAYRQVRSDEDVIIYDLGGDGVARSPEYARLVARVRETVESDVPDGATVLVASRGDDGLLALVGRDGWHFPRDSDGKYAGHYPADSDAAIAHLEALRAQGASHLVLPRTAFWWLDHYEGLREHLEANHRQVRSDEDVIVYDLGQAPLTVPAQATSIAGRRNGANGAGDVADLTPELISDLQPSTLAAASRYRNGDKTRRVLVLGVFLAGRPNTAEHIVATLARSSDFEVSQRWVALGADPSDELAPVTALSLTEPTPKYSLLNRLLAEEDLGSYDFVVTTDDDIILPDGFLDLFLGVQERLGFDLAQPARTLNSYVDHPIVLQQRGVVARRTMFVEIGPLVSFGREIYDLVLPFDETNPMGWGFENVWSHLLREHGRSQGIIDAVPVDHSIRVPVAHYEWADAATDRERYLARHPHLTLEECFRVLEVVGVDR